jgi:hypothetical protein
MQIDTMSQPKPTTSTAQKATTPAKPEEKV